MADNYERMTKAELVAELKARTAGPKTLAVAGQTVDALKALAFKRWNNGRYVEDLSEVQQALRHVLSHFRIDPEEL